MNILQWEKGGKLLKKAWGRKVYMLREKEKRRGSKTRSEK